MKASLSKQKQLRKRAGIAKGKETLRKSKLIYCTPVAHIATLLKTDVSRCFYCKKNILCQEFCVRLLDWQPPKQPWESCLVCFRPRRMF